MTYYIFVENEKLSGCGQIVQYGIINIEVSKEVYDEYSSDPLKYVYSEGEIILNPNYEEEKQEQENEQFNKEFFNTSLGYVRRKVTMKDGSERNFLTDILPLLQVGVPILTYTRELAQNKVLVTETFINECKQQLLNDFYGN